MLRLPSSVSSRTSIHSDSAPRKCKGANQKLCLLPGMYVCIHSNTPNRLGSMPIRTIHAWFSIKHCNRSNLVYSSVWYTPHDTWLMVMILIILISLYVCLSIPLSYSNPESISSSSFLFLWFDCNHMHFAEHYHTKFHPMSVVGEITVNKQTSSAI